MPHFYLLCNLTFVRFIFENRYIVLYLSVFPFSDYELLVSFCCHICWFTSLPGAFHLFPMLPSPFLADKIDIFFAVLLTVWNFAEHLNFLYMVMIKESAQKFHKIYWYNSIDDVVNGRPTHMIVFYGTSKRSKWKFLLHVDKEIAELNNCSI